MGQTEPRLATEAQICGGAADAVKAPVLSRARRWRAAERDTVEAAESSQLIRWQSNCFTHEIVHGCSQPQGCDITNPLERICANVPVDEMQRRCSNDTAGQAVRQAMGQGTPLLSYWGLGTRRADDAAANYIITSALILSDPAGSYL